MAISASEPELAWLADAPIFIDGQQIGAFYDAVVGPAFRAVQLQVSVSQAEQQERSAKGSLGSGLGKLFPWVKLDAGVEVQRTRSVSLQDGQSIVLQPIEGAARQLVQLCLHYLVNQRDRICVITGGAEVPGSGDISASPRMIAFMDLAPGTTFLPQAAELNDGRVVTFFGPLIDRFRQDDGTLPDAYPRSIATAEGMAQRNAYWKWYAERWNTDEAVKVVEEVIGDGGRPRWVNYRMTFTTGEALNLHVIAHGDHDC